MDMLSVVTAIASVVAAIAAIAAFAKVGKTGSSDDGRQAQQLVIDRVTMESQRLQDVMNARMNGLDGKVDAAASATVQLQTNMVKQFSNAGMLQEKRFGDMQKSVSDSLSGFQTGITKQLQDSRNAQDKNSYNLQHQMTTSLKNMQDTVHIELDGIRTDNNKNLENIRTTVDEKLQKTLNERIAKSFEVVNQQLEAVTKGLGEMQSMAQNVGDLKKVLSNVKTRGIVGEVQLGAILQEILAPGQYEENVETVPGSGKRVEYAVRIPGNDGSFIYLPIDSKFPAETYLHLQDAKESGDAAAIEEAGKELEARLKSEAKDVHDKYLKRPYTTVFGMVFLPSEGLYSEVVNRRGLVADIQQRYSVNVAGPSTMAAMLNALEMGFQTVAIQKRADEIHRVLIAVKGELPKFKRELEKAQRQLNTASKTIDSLVGTRTRAMERSLRGVTSEMSLEEADGVLGIDAVETKAFESGGEE